MSRRRLGFGVGGIAVLAVLCVLATRPTRSLYSDGEVGPRQVNVVVQDSYKKPVAGATVEFRITGGSSLRQEPIHGQTDTEGRIAVPVGCRMSGGRELDYVWGLVQHKVDTDARNGWRFLWGLIDLRSPTPPIREYNFRESNGPACAGIMEEAMLKLPVERTIPVDESAFKNHPYIKNFARKGVVDVSSHVVEVNVFQP